jgi:hypothetical protein
MRWGVGKPKGLGAKPLSIFFGVFLYFLANGFLTHCNIIPVKGLGLLSSLG